MLGIVSKFLNHLQPTCEIAVMHIFTDSANVNVEKKEQEK